MFYLKYRPQNLSEIDNTQVRQILQKILSADNLPHAFLFVGQKGTGKTSTARIFAKAINCLENKFAGKGDSTEPCNQCSNCKSITTGSSADVLELDAASNRGIEEVKNLIKETAFAPMTNRYRVFIIDEAHMITNDGFNALLKTLEEPPKTSIFILATTNEEKLPKTIVSRCLKINFGKAKKQDIINMLKRILKSEKVNLSDEVIKIIANHSENSFRDAAKLLEEIIIQKINDPQEVEKFLGIRGKTNLRELIEKKDIKKILEFLELFSQSGGNFKHLIEELLEELRLILLYKKEVITEKEYASTLTLSEISLLIKLLLEAYQNLKISPIDSIPLEIALVEFYNKTNKS